jgi:hypothetical protein
MTPAEKEALRRAKMGLGEGEVLPEDMASRPDLGIDQKKAGDFMRAFKGETAEMDPKKQTRWQRIKAMMMSKPVAMK